MEQDRETATIKLTIDNPFFDFRSIYLNSFSDFNVRKIFSYILEAQRYKGKELDLAL